MNYRRVVGKRRFIIILFFIFYYAFLEESIFAYDNLLSLEECINLTKENNPRLSMAKKELEKAMVEIKAKYANYFPEINFSSNYTRTFNNLYGEYGVYSKGFSIEQALYTGGATPAEIEEAKANLSYKYAEYKNVELEEIFELKQVYYQIIKTMYQVDILEEILRRREKDVELIRLLYNAGREKKANLLQAEAEVSEVKLSINEANSQLKILKCKLNEIMGRKLDTPLEIKGELSVIDLEDSLSNILEEALANRPEIRELEAKIKATKAQLKYAKSGILPQANFNYTYGWQDSRLFHGNDNWTAKVSVDLPLFDRFITRYQVKEIRTEVERLNLNKEMKEKQIELEVKEAYENFLINKQSVDVATESLRARRVRADLSRLKYKQGIISFTVLRDAELDLSSAEHKRLDALYNLNISLAKLRKVQAKE
ncbi:MAG: TolC family protein [Candidatus Omnitrophica bacterium]|nr:TolC family protein [Candidatus Omnitrophota bacterium]